MTLSRSPPPSGYASIVLESLHIQNFRCLRDVSIDFTPLTVLVGPNGSGKTTILQALQPQPPPELWRNDQSLSLARQVRLDGAPLQQKAIPGSGLQKAPWSHRHLELKPGAMRRPNRVAPATALAQDGSNLTNVVETLGRRRQGQLSERLCELVPLFQDVDVRPVGNGEKQLRFQDRWDESVWYTPEQVSDGTMLLLALLTLGFVDDSPDLVTIESPEQALHPFLIEAVVTMLRDLAEGRLAEKATQVVVATHSAQLLEFVKPSEVRFVSRDLRTGETSVRAAPVDTKDFERAWREYDESLGELWLSGSLGGVPAPPRAQ